MFNLLANSGTLGYGVKTIADINLNWIGQLIRILIEGIGIVGVGIIVFTLILKTIVLPLDIYSRINGKKQALIMERMRPQMEKLQKQYANDKNMYQQKVVELQKKSGYSMIGACLPMIVSLLIFIIVFQAFSTYSQYANLKNYNDMVNIYNGVVQTYVIDGETPNENGFLYVVKDGDEVVDYSVDYAKFTAYYNADMGQKQSDWVIKNEEEVFLHLAGKYKETHTGYDGAFDANVVNLTDGNGLTTTAVGVRNTLVSYYLEAPAAQEVKLFYEGKNDKYAKSHNNSFLWVGNLWYPDSTLNKEMPDFSKFKSTISKAGIGDDYAESYNKVTAALTEQKNQYNGYFVLIILSIGLMLLQQWLSMRANKSVNDLSTVDGSGARSNKMMMIMMPLIYGAFSFFYSASFSLYMITNTLYGLITMLIINKCVDVWFKKKEANGELDMYLSKKNRKVKANKRK
ncbi:MAG: membrane protein insertase YidC [Clostridia bacterium]|nr:membrane protein insertase YidC [Clostridia bacterium]